MHKLAVFDFDATIINDNSDTYINDLLINKYNAHKIHLNNGSHENMSLVDLRRFIFPQSIEKLYSEYNWPTRMNAALQYIHKNFDCNLDEILNTLEKIKIDESMKNLFQTLIDNKYDIYILSDANTLFIETILNKNGLLHIFKDRIIANRTRLDDDGILKIIPFYTQFKHDKKPFDCSYCVKDCGQPSICKRELLKELIDSRIMKMGENNEISASRHVIYCGDGRNDFCPGLILQKNDLYFPRNGYNLAKMLQNEQYLSKINAKVKFWSNAEDIIKHLEFF